MEQEHKWFSLSKFSITIGLLLVLSLVILINIGLFITGPSLRYEDKIATQEALIRQNHENIQELDRHVFAYVIYSGHDDASYYWFNEQGELLTTRKQSEIDIEQAKQKGALENATVRIGYGYENPVYVIENDDAEVYLDLDTYEQVFYRKKGEAV